MTALQPIVALYDTLLQPVFAQNPLLDFFGLHPERLTLLDWLATVRVCVAMRQIRTAEHAKTKTANVANLSFTHSALTTLTVIFGGEVSSQLSKIGYIVLKQVVAFDSSILTPTTVFPDHSFDGCYRYSCSIHY